MYSDEQEELENWYNIFS